MSTTVKKSLELAEQLTGGQGKSAPYDGPWIQTFTGLKFHLIDPQPSMIDIVDIAHSLSLQCRYTGHCSVHYSIAEHCVRISEAMEDKMGLGGHCRDLVLWGLMHDASEAYLVDLPRPWKHATELGRIYREHEMRIMRVIVRRFGMGPSVEPEVVKLYDRIMLSTERRDLLPTTVGTDASWGHGGLDLPTPLAMTIKPWPWQKAEERFLERFYDLTGEASQDPGVLHD